MNIAPTDRTFIVLAFARRAADARHDRQVTTEHILYGLVMEGSGIAANLLHNLGITFSLPRDTIPRAHDSDTLCEDGRAEYRNLSGEAKTFMKAAQAEGIRCREMWPKPDPPFAWIGTEHLLMALTEKSSTAGGEVLRREVAKLKMSPEDLHQEVMALIFG